MINLNAILKYLGLFLLIYILLFAGASSQPVAQFTNEAYRTVTTPILQAIFPKAYLKLEKDSPPESDSYTIRAVFISKKKIEERKNLARQQGNAQIDLKATEYDIYLHLLFTSFLLFLWSLILVTPISLKQKLLGLLMGSILFYAFSVGKISIFLLDLFNQSEYDMYKLSETGGLIAGKLSYVLKSLGVSAFVVVFIWILVGFRKGILNND